MSHACHRFWKCHKTLSFCSLLTRCTIPSAYHAKRHLNVQKCSVPLSFLHFWLRNVLRATTACTFSTSQLPKVVRCWGVLGYILTTKQPIAPVELFRHLNFQFLDACFVHFDFEMCFIATTACTFSTSQLPKVVRCWGVLYILTSKCASRHNGVQFFISHLASWLRTRRFSEPTFRPSGASNPLKNTVFRDFPTFSRICIFFLLTLSLLWSSLFCSPLLSASAQLCFSSVHIVGSLTSKLPSTSIYKNLFEVQSDCSRWSQCQEELASGGAVA